jgi:hypothetical protein
MYTVELLEQAKSVAQQLGYQLRQEFLGGSGGGSCEIFGQKWIFIDLALTIPDQLEQVLEALREEPGIDSVALTPPMSRLLGMRKSA